MVRHDDVDVLVADDVERFGAVRREEQIELAAEHDPHRVQHALLVVDEQQAGAVQPSCRLGLHALDRFLELRQVELARRTVCSAGAGRLIGRMTVKAEPLPTTDSTCSSP